MVRVLFVFGTRPEAIKLSPVVLHLRSRPRHFQASICVTGQHRSMLDPVLRLFGLESDYDLDIMQPGQTLSQSSSRIIGALDGVMNDAKPEMTIVQGDTTTTFCGALASFYHRVPVAHVEAGLRTGDLLQPFPEELNRVLTTRLTALHFAATQRSAQNLIADNVDPATVHVTGNSGIDAVLQVRNRLASGDLAGQEHPWLDASKRLILVTAHRRESFGEGLESICRGLARLANRGDVQIVYPVHRNPNVMEPVHRLLANTPNVVLIEPLEYVPFVEMMQRAYILITDSGGIQEEGPSLGKPILVMRDKTERPEAVLAGTVKLVGASEERIFEGASMLLDDHAEYEGMSRVHNPYGDGCASERIGVLIRSFFTANSL